MQNNEMFKEVMSRFPTGVTIVTGEREGGAPVGFTANAVASVSLEPQLMLVCADRDSASLPVLLNRRTFGVSVLRAEDEAIAYRFSRENPDERFRNIQLRPTSVGPPVLQRALAWLGCRVWKHLEAGDHVILIGEVVDAGVGSEGPPLVFFRRGYGTFSGAPEG